MSYSQRTGLVYIPTSEGGFAYRNDPTEGGTGRSKLGFNTGAGAFSATVAPAGTTNEGTRATEASVRGFWKCYRTHMGV